MNKYFIYKILFMALLLFFIPFGYSEVKAIDYSNISYGIVNFKTKSCYTNTSYTEFATGRIGYTNGCYGADGAFLGMYNGKVKFMLSGVIGLVDASEVTVIDIPKYDATTYISSYRVLDGNLQHCVSLDTSYSSFSCYSLGKNTIGLKTGVYYLSYDGHYFYEYTVANFKKMIDDYKKGVRTNAVNKTPYYNYYQFVTHRTKTNQTAADFNTHIKTMTTDSSSKMYNLGSAFITSQNKYGSNGSLMYSVAGNESDWGTSGYALNRNNLFGHNAYDSNPDEADYYSSPSESVAIHAEKFISEGYMDPCDWSDTLGAGFNSSICLQGRYNGGNLGNKASGINVRYASDPYWGEKAASNYYNLESKTGISDYGYYTLGIKTSYTSYNVRKEPSTSSTILYKTTPTTDYPFIILGKVIGSDGNLWYKIQTDPTLDSTRSKLIQDQGEYNYNNNYGYVRYDAVDIYIAGTKAIEDTTNITYNITFNANGGKFSDNTTTKVVNTKKGEKPSITSPTKEGYTFAGWSPTVVAASKATTYTATWTANEYNITFNANGGKFSDNTTSKIIKVKYNELPTVEEPTKDGYVFNGWSPTVTNVSKATIYTATWIIEEKPDETGLILREGLFNLHKLDEENGQLVLTGYNTIKGIDNTLATNIEYKIIFENVDTLETVEQKANRMTTNIPYDVYSVDGKNYKYSWFTVNLDIDNLSNGTYRIYIVASSDKYYSKNVINNKSYSTQITGYNSSNGNNVIIKNNYNDKNAPIELTVRDEVLANKTATSKYNQFDTYAKFEFVDELLYLRGLSYSYGMDLSKNASVTRKIIFENMETFETYRYDLGSITTGEYEAILPVDDKLDKTKAWYDKKIDISNIPKGKYVIYITTSSNVTDISEFTEKIGRQLDDVKATINNKNYSFSINSKKGNRIELEVS